MLVLEPVITARLREALPAEWIVFGHSIDAGPRNTYPRCGVAFSTTTVVDSKTSAANVQPAWRITLVTRRSDQAASALDAAFGMAVEHLHNWLPGKHAGRIWQRMGLSEVEAPLYAEEGLVGLELFFTTAARYDGQP